MNFFVDRKEELERLRGLYASDSQGQLAVLYGRRRLGKTCLLRRFCMRLPHCYFMADRAGEVSQRKSLAIAMSTALGEPLLGSVSYDDWYALFAAFDRFRPQNEKIVLILDEYQYICQVQPAFSSYIQKYWDEHWSKSNILLILCGSVTSMMYQETMAQSAPLYGRASAQLLLRPLPYQYIKDFLPGFSNNELVRFYSLGGGVPRYLELLQEYASFADALESLVLRPTGLMYQEARYLLHEEITSPHVCWSILQALGTGTGRISEIAGRLSLPANQLTRYMELLRDLHLVYREVPVLEKNPERSKKGFYQVADPFLRLWFGSIYPYDSFLEFGQMEAIRERLGPLIESHVAFCFEQLCRFYVQKNATRYNCLKVGRQWSGKYEIDVAGVDADLQLILVGECKWSRKKVGLSVYRQLQAKVIENRLPIARSCKYLLFSRAGFTDELKKMEKTDNALELIPSVF